MSASALLVKRLREETGCGMHTAKRALELREDNLELAKEYVARHNLAAVMPDSARFPLWHALQERRKRKGLKHE